eukprot:scaffold96027_cov75-Phaeocystis_antarctica.AAC.3
MPLIVLAPRHHILCNLRPPPRAMAVCPERFAHRAVGKISGPVREPKIVLSLSKAQGAGEHHNAHDCLTVDVLRTATAASAHSPVRDRGGAESLCERGRRKIGAKSVA